MDLANLTARALLRLHADIGEQLRKRGILRSANNPTGDLAEYLFCKAFDWKLAGKSQANIDAIGKDGNRYQIKGRRMTRNKPARQVSAIRELAGGHFDFLAGVLFTETYEVQRAALIPQAFVVERAKFVARSNSHRFILRDDVWESPYVRDVTSELRAVEL